MPRQPETRTYHFVGGSLCGECVDLNPKFWGVGTEWLAPLWVGLGRTPEEETKSYMEVYMVSDSKTLLFQKTIEK